MVLRSAFPYLRPVREHARKSNVLHGCARRLSTKCVTRYHHVPVASTDA